MNKILIFVSVLVILSLALSACGTEISGGIQLPGGEGESAAAGNTLIYVLLAVIVLVAVVALVAKR